MRAGRGPSPTLAAPHARLELVNLLWLWPRSRDQDFIGLESSLDPCVFEFKVLSIPGV